MDIEKIILMMLEQTDKLIEANKELAENNNRENEKWREHSKNKDIKTCRVIIAVIVLIGFIFYCMYFTPTHYSMGDNNYNSNTKIENGVDK